MFDFLFPKKQSAQAMAEVLEDGRALMNQEMQKAKYRDYKGAEPQFEVAVRVEPAGEAAYPAKMKVGMTKIYLIVPGVKVQVKYDPAHKEQVTLDDDNQAILARNPQMIKTEK